MIERDTNLLRSESPEEGRSEMEQSEQYYVNDYTGSQESSNLYTYQKTPTSYSKSLKSHNLRNRLNIDAKHLETNVASRQIDTRVFREKKNLKKDFYKTTNKIDESVGLIKGHNSDPQKISDKMKTRMYTKTKQILNNGHDYEVVKRVKNDVTYVDRTNRDRHYRDEVYDTRKQTDLPQQMGTKKDVTKLEQFFTNLSAKKRAQQTVDEKSNHNNKNYKTSRLKEDPPSRYTDNY